MFFQFPLLGEAQSVFIDYDTKADFSKYKTYAWLVPGDSVFNNQPRGKLYGGTIMHAADVELQRKGMTRVNTHPDAVFIFNTNTEERTKYTQSPTLSVGIGVGGPGYYVAGSAPVAGGKITESTVTDGTLIYDMYDFNTHKLVWTGNAKKTLSFTEDVEDVINKYTQKIFKKLPVSQK